MNSFVYLPKKRGKNFTSSEYILNSGVIHEGKFHSFKSGATKKDGIPIEDLRVTLVVDEKYSATGKDAFYNVNPTQWTFEDRTVEY